MIPALSEVLSCNTETGFSHFQHI